MATTTKKAIIDTATAKEAMAIVGKSLKDVNKAIDNLAALPSEGKAQRGMCAAMFAWGLGLKATGKTEFDKKLYDERFDDYVEKHWPKGDKPADTVLRGYRSQYGAFCRAAFAKYDAKPVVREVLSIANVVLPWRAARIRELLVTEVDGKEVPRTKAPSAREIAAALTLDAKSGDPEAREGDAVFLSLVNVLVDAAGNKKLIAFLKDNEQHAAWLRPALDGAINHRATLAAAAKDGSKVKERMRTSVRVAREAMLAFQASKGNGRRARPNVAAVGRA